jgi:DNA-binding NarL/FixJ family response regulator
MNTRVLLVDDHTMFREALRSLLEKAPGIEVVAEACDGSQVEDLVERHAAEVVVMDVSMPGVSGIEATRRVLEKHPDVRVIALSAYVYKRFVLEMLGAGAVGYVAKSAAGDELVRAIRNAAPGRVYLCPEAASTLAEMSRRGPAPTGTRPGNGRLGRREKEVLCLLAEGMNSTEIGAALHIAASTVDVHRRNIMRKVNLHSVAELTKYAIREGLVLP